MERDSRYDDILHLSRPDSPGHPRMSMIERAAQFSPFAALTGYDDAIRESARFTDEKIEPGELQQAELNEHLRALKWRLGEKPAVRIMCFQKDGRKAGGAYITLQGRVKKILEAEEKLVLDNGAEVAFADIFSMESEALPSGGKED